MMRRPQITNWVPSVAWAIMVVATLGQVPPAVSQDVTGPRFRADGPRAEFYGLIENFPHCIGLAFVSENRCRVGAFSHFDSLFPARTIAAPDTPSRLGRALQEPTVRYVFAGKEHTLDDYLDRRPISGFLLLKGDTILVERYQYGRMATHRLASFSMAKTIVGLLVGIAVSDGVIRSVDDLAEAYVPALKGSAYGPVRIKDLLLMKSGVFFREDYADPASDIYTLARLTLEQDPGGSVGALRRFDWRRAPPGQLHSYSSADTVALGLVLAAATGRTVSDYASQKLWQADASWTIDATGQEITYAYVNAVLRDWGRLGLMLARQGDWPAKGIVPRAWLEQSGTYAVDSGSALSTYGYHLWHSADRRRLFLWGLRGQYVMADPETGLVLVQTALSSDDFLDLELYELWRSIRMQLR